MSASEYVYVVMAQAFEYNDEYSYATEGGSNVGGYKDKARADEEALQQNIAALRMESNVLTLNEMHQSYDEDKIADFIRETFGEDSIESAEDLWDWDIPSTATDEQVAKLVKFLADKGVHFYYVERVEVLDSHTKTA
jgi:hypothetical protein